MHSHFVWENTGTTGVPPVDEAYLLPLSGSDPKFLQGKAHVGVAWAVYADGGALAEGVLGAYTVESMFPGPDRRVKKRDAPPVAYSGDDWVGSPSAASTLGFVSPSGDETDMSLVGCGAQQFAFSKPGQWTVRLTAGAKVREAVVNIINGGFRILLR